MPFFRLKWTLLRQLLLVGLTGLVACKEDESTIGLDLSNQDQRFKSFATDTVTVRTSTVLIDSIATSNTNYLLVGRYHDDRLGLIETKSFVSLGLDDGGLSLGTDPVLDSLVFTLHYTYSYGDTTQLQEINIHQLDKKLDADRTYYNSESVAYAPQPIATHRFAARPRRGRPLRIRLPNELGQQLIAAAEDGEISTDADFQTFFRGLALVPGSADNAAVLGFRVNSDSTAIELHYHFNDDARTAKSYLFKASAGNARFHQVRNERSATPLAPLQKIYQALPSSQTAEEAYVAASIGFRTRIEFPYLHEFNKLGYVGINGASLVIRPVRNTIRSTMPPPAALTFYHEIGRNRPGSLLSETYSTLPASVTYVADVINNLFYYKYPLTPFVVDQVRKNQPDGEALLLSLPGEGNAVSLDRLVLGGGKHAQEAIKLEVVYTVLRQE